MRFECQKDFQAWGQVMSLEEVRTRWPQLAYVEMPDKFLGDRGFMMRHVRYQRNHEIMTSAVFLLPADISWAFIKAEARKISGMVYEIHYGEMNSKLFRIPKKYKAFSIYSTTSELRAGTLVRCDHE